MTRLICTFLHTVTCCKIVKGLSKHKHKSEEQDAKKQRQGKKTPAADRDKALRPAVLHLYAQKGTFRETYI